EVRKRLRLDRGEHFRTGRLLGSLLAVPLRGAASPEPVLALDHYDAVEQADGNVALPFHPHQPGELPLAVARAVPILRRPADQTPQLVLGRLVDHDAIEGRLRQVEVRLRGGVDLVVRFGVGDSHQRPVAIRKLAAVEEPSPYRYLAVNESDRDPLPVMLPPLF